MGGIEAALAEHAFEHLFIECLGWDRVRSEVSVEHRGIRADLSAVAHKRGFTVFLCPAHRTVLADRHLLRGIQRQLRKTHHEHILIHYCDTPYKQVWQWATTIGDGRSVSHREHPFFSNEPPERLLKRIEGLAIGFAEEEQTTLLDVLDRVRAALFPDCDLNLFAKYPTFAAESDCRAMAMKRGEPGAFERFVEFHIPLAKKASRMMVRWFGIDPEDAQQTAIIGLIEAARRFDPERGFQFSTYASFWIRQICQRYGLEWGMEMRVPTHWFWPCYRLQFKKLELIAAHGISEGLDKFHEELDSAGVSRDQWATFQAARRMKKFSEYDRPARVELENTFFSDEIDYVAEREVCREIRDSLNCLTEREAEVIRLRYGLDEPEKTLQEIAIVMGVTRERVRQIQARAEVRLQRTLANRDLLDGFEYDEQINTEESIQEDPS